jgi:hypothetical protein
MSKPRVFCWIRGCFKASQISLEFEEVLEDILEDKKQSSSTFLELEGFVGLQSVFTKSMAFDIG